MSKKLVKLKVKFSFGKVNEDSLYRIPQHKKVGNAMQCDDGGMKTFECDRLSPQIFWRVVVIRIWAGREKI